MWNKEEAIENIAGLIHCVRNNSAPKSVLESWYNAIHYASGIKEDWDNCWSVIGYEVMERPESTESLAEHFYNQFIEMSESFYDMK